MAAEPPPRSSTWAVLVMTMAIQSMVSMAVLTLPAMAPAVARSLQVSPSLIGGYIALVYAGAMAASLLAGQLVARCGAIRVSQLGLLLCGAGLALSAVPSLAAAGFGAVLIGLGYGPITPASSHLLAAATPAHRMSLIFSIKQTGVPLGGMLAGALVPSLVLLAGVPRALLALCVANILCAVLVQPIRSGLDSDRRPGQRLAMTGLAGPLRLVAQDPGLRRLAAFSFVFSAVQLCLSAYLVTYLNASQGYSLIAAGFALSVAQAGGVLGRIVWGYVSDRWLQARRTLAVLAGLMSFCAAATAALSASIPVPVVLALMAAFGASATGWNGVYLAEVARLAPPGMAGGATGGALAVTYFGVVLGPIAFAWISGLVVPTALCCWSLLARAESGAELRPHRR